MLLVIHFWFTVFMVGLAVFVQVVHYPLFLEVPENAFKKYSNDHQRLTGYVVIPVMLGELFTGMALLFFLPLDGILLVLTGLLFAVWVLTLGFAAPIHQKLSRGKSVPLINLLLKIHLARTLCWSLRSILLINCV